MSFDPSAAALPGSGVFGLPHSERDAAVVLVPVPERVRELDARARADAAPVIEAGGVENGGPELAAAAARVNAASAELNAWVEAEVARLLAGGKRVGVVGGDHAVAFGAI